MMAGRILRLFQELYLKKDSFALQVLSLIFPFVQRVGRFRKYDRDDRQEVECYSNQRTRDALNRGVTQNHRCKRLSWLEISDDLHRSKQ